MRSQLEDDVSHDRSNSTTLKDEFVGLTRTVHPHVPHASRLSNRKPSTKRRAKFAIEHHTCIRFIPPIHFVNHPLASTTPTVLKGPIVGLTHHTFYETHPNLDILGGILKAKFDTGDPKPHVCYMNMATLCESESASIPIVQCMPQRGDRSDMAHGERIVKRRRSSRRFIQSIYPFNATHK